MNRHRLLLAAVLSLALVPPSFAAAAADPVATADALGAALAAGDESAVQNLLDEDVLIYEMGGQESSRNEYAAHHLKGDIAFMATMKTQPLERVHSIAGDLAVVNTRSRLAGTRGGKPLELLSTETLVMKRSAQGWRITHIHWSSRPVDPPKTR